MRNASAATRDVNPGGSCCIQAPASPRREGDQGAPSGNKASGKQTRGAFMVFSNTYYFRHALCNSWADRNGNGPHTYRSDFYMTFWVHVLFLLSHHEQIMCCAFSFGPYLEVLRPGPDSHLASWVLQALHSVRKHKAVNVSISGLGWVYQPLWQ